MYGVTYPRMKFQSQLDAVESATPLERMGSGKISPTTTHAAGPQVEANEAMYRQTNTIRTVDAALECGSAVPTAAMMNWKTSIAAAPMIRSLRRPRRSIAHHEIGVLPTLTTEVATETVKAFLIPEFWKKVVP
jgi:hypothetical protein